MEYYSKDEVNKMLEHLVKMIEEDRANILKLRDLFVKLADSSADGMKSINSKVDGLKSHLDKGK